TKFVLENERLTTPAGNKQQTEFFSSGDITTLKRMVENITGIKPDTGFYGNRPVDNDFIR
ncbi:MAG: hypothetical protein LBQ01_02485, partial [Prevotellaceae bacterium]|nr:hypothetical protein [Prevotellaceae bacterium]